MERKMTKFGRPAPEIEGLVAASGLSPLIVCSLDTGDKGLIEVTITLGDVASLLHLHVVGRFHSFKQLHVDDTIEMLVELLEVSAAEVCAETIQCHGSYVRLSWLHDLYEIKIEACDWIVAARAYLLHLLGCTLFSNKSATHVHMVFLDALCDLTQSAGYTWGIATLVHIYDNLNDASKSTARQLVGYITLLQCWIYEHFSSVSCAVVAEDYDERRLSACRWTFGKALPVSTYWRCLDRLTLDAVCWIPYDNHRSFREFKVISLFSGHLRWGPLTVIHHRRWLYDSSATSRLFRHTLLCLRCLLQKLMIDGYNLVTTLHQLPGLVLHDLAPIHESGTTRDPPRVPSVQQDEEFVEPDMYQQPMAAAVPNKADIDQHHLWHVVDDFAVIADRLDRLLNLRILTKRTEVFTVVEECVGITRRYIGQPTVAHRSMRRRHTDGH
ncbi:Protein MAIN-LIKE 2 [Glycine soja]